MRVSREEAQASRRRIIDIAAQLFRECGFDGIGVADLMKASGMTHGGFYRHFASKGDLAAEATIAAYRRFEQDSEGKPVEALLSRYISKEHRDDLGAACPTSVFGVEAARQTEPVRKALVDGVRNWLDTIEGSFGETGSSDDADRRALSIQLAALAVGALVLSRAASADDALSEEILAAGLSKGLALATGPSEHCD